MTIQEFGNFLYLLRIGKKLSIHDASREMGIDSNFLGRIERGDTSSFPRYKTLSHLSDFYNFKFQYIPAQLLIVSIPLPTTFKSMNTIEIVGEFLEEEAEGFKNKDVPIPLLVGEKILIERALSQTGYNRLDAARILGIGERTLYRKLKDYGIKL